MFLLSVTTIVSITSNVVWSDVSKHLDKISFDVLESVANNRSLQNPSFR